MLKKIINQARIQVQITPLDPLLIKSGQATVGGVNMAFVRTYRSDGEGQPYIPGSSLKGVFRSYAEKICRSLRNNPVPVCLPYVHPGREQPGEGRQASCGLQMREGLSSRDIYKLSCPTCRLFGSLGFTGRFSISDAYLNGDHQLEIRDGVAIDRITGGAVHGAKYDLEILSRGSFLTSIELRNFERWQLGLVGLVLRDLEGGWVQVGSGKSRGLGHVRGEILSFEINYFNREFSILTGLAGICDDDERQSYGFFPELQVPAPELPTAQYHGLRRKYDLGLTWKSVLEPAVKDLLKYIETVKWPQELEESNRGKS